MLRTNHLKTQDRRQSFRSRRWRARFAIILYLVVLAVLMSGMLPWWLIIISLPAAYIGFIQICIYGGKEFVRGFFSTLRRRGHADRLVGKIGYSVVLAGPRKRPFATIGKTLKEVRSGFRFLEGEASRFGQRLEFQSAKRRPDFIEIEKPDLSASNCLEPAALDRIYEAVAALPVWAEADRFDGFFVIVLTQWAGYRAQALCAHPANDREKEICICPSIATASTYAHEVLHLFGAMDLYLEGSEEAAQADRLKRGVCRLMDKALSIEVDGSIMKQSMGEKSFVDAGNAYAVGWVDDLPFDRDGANENPSERIYI